MICPVVNSKTAIIVPVYNEANVIKDVIDSLSKDFKHIICVDDGSADNSGEIIANSAAYLVTHPINMGQGAALQTGIEFARQLDMDYFVTFDADGQHRIQDVKAMLKEIETKEYDIILGSRFLGEAVGITKTKYVILKMAIAFSNLTSGLKLTDTHNGLRVFNRKVAEELQITMPDMSHASEILEIIAEKQYRYKEIPVTIEYTDYSRSKGQSVVNAVNIGFDMLLRKIAK
jgi:glycosyltransferase involved in cell wall biosynthesis